MHKNNTPTKESRPCEYCSLGCTTHIYVSIFTYTKPCIQQALSTLLSPHPLPPTPRPHPTPPPNHPPPPFWQTTFSNCIFLNENDGIPIQIAFNYAPRSPIDNKPALVQVMAWCRTGDKPLPVPMMTQFSLFRFDLFDLSTIKNIDETCYCGLAG